MSASKCIDTVECVKHGQRKSVREAPHVGLPLAADAAARLIDSHGGRLRGRRGRAEHRLGEVEHAGRADRDVWSADQLLVAALGPQAEAARPPLGTGHERSSEMWPRSRCRRSACRARLNRVLFVNALRVAHKACNPLRSSCPSRLLVQRPCRPTPLRRAARSRRVRLRAPALLPPSCAASTANRTPPRQAH
jgi:hypothetical protein